MDNDTLEAVRNVVDRVTSYQDGAPEGTVEAELRSGLDEAGVQLEDAQVQALAQAIDDDPAHVDVERVLS
jgi:hypothetical protein